MCFRCRLASHHPVKCAEFQKIPIEDRQPEDWAVLKTGRQMRWKRCPHCQALVERSIGWNFMTVSQPDSYASQPTRRPNLRLHASRCHASRFAPKSHLPLPQRKWVAARFRRPATCCSRHSRAVPNEGLW
ncbi:hypothetical protein BCR44DRAFT_1422681 [Catenaria anguillulae PL171]|uniref:Uncharacterized protein n=1 Tax=Catenaria anguillulae PL171 TaxID=765915 RepID=A0A1Y2I3D2_9FUNG|nr:hypothetical protein BCR44DRAFT_1422681 [Catenaria anguillulae PL171]